MSVSSANFRNIVTRRHRSFVAQSLVKKIRVVYVSPTQFIWYRTESSKKKQSSTRIRNPKHRIFKNPLLPPGKTTENARQMTRTFFCHNAAMPLACTQANLSIFEDSRTVCMPRNMSVRGILDASETGPKNNEKVEVTKLLGDIVASIHKRAPAPSK